MTDPTLIDVRCLAHELSLSVAACYRMAEERRIPSLKIGKALRFKLPDVLAALDNQNNGNGHE